MTLGNSTSLIFLLLLEAAPRTLTGLKREERSRRQSTLICPEGFETMKSASCAPVELRVVIVVAREVQLSIFELASCYVCRSTWMKSGCYT